MFPVVIALVAQLFITAADAHLRRQTQPLWNISYAAWVPRYAISRLLGLMLRLYPVFVLPIAGASLLFSSSAIAVSSCVGWRQGESLTMREWLAISLIVLAIGLRAL